jgi:hypothetical protein
MSPLEFRTGVIRPVECYKEGWELIKDQYWLMLAVTVVGVIIGGATLYIGLGAMLCGIYYCYFQKIDGRQVIFDGLFKGFGYFVPGLIVILVIMVPTIVVMAGIYFPFIMAAIMGSKLSEDELMILLSGTFLVELIFSVLMVCIHTLLMFSFPLIVDRNLSAWQAMKTSARAVMKNLGGAVGLFAVGFVLSLAGYLLLCVGIYLVIPILIAGNIVAYRKIFPSLNPGNSNFPPGNFPPAPGAFHDAGRAI